MHIDYITFSNLIIDDIVFPDGRTSMNVLGGAGTHALVGMRLWNGRLGYSATVGSDLNPAHYAALNARGVDTSGLVQRDGMQTARAWQVFEWDDYRHEIFRTDLEAFARERIQPADLPEAYWRARGFHIQWGTLDEMQQLVSLLRDANPDVTLVMEVTPSQLAEGAAGFRPILPQLNLFSPDIEESAAITGQTEPMAICDALLEMGAPAVALRMGASGSLVKAQSGTCWRIPAVPTDIVDVTGAGNAYCGGFLTGLGDGHSLLEAALRAAVSASFALEQLGLPSWTVPPDAEARRRLAWARDRVEPA